MLYFSQTAHYYVSYRKHTFQKDISWWTLGVISPEQNFKCIRIGNGYIYDNKLIFTW